MFRQIVAAALLVCALGAPDTKKWGRTRFPLTDNRIVGGVDVSPGEIPYQLQLQYYGSLMCGASIISENWALTAAHCVDGASPDSLTVIAGSINLSGQGGSSHSVAEIIVHEDYYNVNDLAVLRVNEPFQLGGNVAAVDLPEQDQVTAGGTPAVVSGWGTTTEGGDISDILQKVEVPIVDDESCNNSYDNQVDPDAEICAGVEQGGKDSCQGDSGGPLVADGVQVGIVSWGYGCAEPSYPGVYTQVSTYRDWIKGKTGV